MPHAHLSKQNGIMISSKGKLIPYDNQTWQWKIPYNINGYLMGKSAINDGFSIATADL